MMIGKKDYRRRNGITRADIKTDTEYIVDGLTMKR
jgi:hypothetical protein